MHAIYNMPEDAVSYRSDPAIIHKLPKFTTNVVSIDRLHVENLILEQEYLSKDII
jgi:hypothetical protein